MLIDELVVQVTRTSSTSPAVRSLMPLSSMVLE